MITHKLFYFLLGATPENRHTEQHDVFFCIAASLADTIPLIKNFWPEAKDRIHIDAWREVTQVDGYKINIIPKEKKTVKREQLFFVNLGGYLPGSFEEHHHKILTIAPAVSGAIRAAKQTSFYKNYNSETGHSHVDDKYGVDVDEVFNVEDILSAEQKKIFSIELKKSDGLPDDELHIGYLKLSKLLNEE